MLNEEELEEVNQETPSQNIFMEEEPQGEEDQEVFLTSTQEPADTMKKEHIPKYTSYLRLVVLSSVFVGLFLLATALIGVEIYFQTQNQTFEGYQVKNLKETANGMEADLNYISSTNKQNSPYDKDITNLKIQIFYETKTRIHVKILDAENPKRWQVPEDIIKSKTPSKAPVDVDYSVELKTPFGLIVKRKSNDEIIFDTTDLPLIYSNYYLSISTKLPTANPNIYGLGERNYNFRLPEDNKTYVMFNKDQLTPEYKNLYGTHPFYIEKRKQTSHGVFFFNSNAQEVNLNPYKLEYRTIGGILDFYLFTGPTPQEVIKQYHEVIGKPVMIPYWTLGFHQCRWGYKDINETKAVVEGYKKHQIPLETMWNDIDYMDHYKLFTIDPINYPQAELKKFVDELHENDQHYMVIVDPGVKTEIGYEMYEEGLRDKLYITKPDGVTPIVNKVWPGLTVFPDFTNPKAQTYWGKYIEKFYNQIPVDGLWLDMNEIVGFCDGECTENTIQSSKVEKIDENHPPYMPSGDVIYSRALYMDSKDSLSTHFNTHSLMAHYENKATRFHLDRIMKKRSLIITRSSFAGTGHTSSKWLGDNFSTWNDLKYSISGILSMNLFGFPLIGSDICGFLGNTTEELCIRWYQVGCYYPFSRNHNGFDSKPQEPWILGDRVINASRTAIYDKYAILPYYYTQFYKSHVEGGAVVRSLSLEFPFDISNDINYIDTQFMVGPALMISPVLHQGATSVKAYFPTEQWSNVWYDFKTGIEVKNTGVYQNISAPLDHIPVHIRGGTIVPKQEPGMTTKQSRLNPFQLIVASDGALNAFGDLYIDDGISLDSISGGKYTLIEYNLTPGKLISSFKMKGYDVSHLVMKEVTVYGAQNACDVKVNSQNFTNFEFESETGVLKLKDVLLRMDTQFEINWKWWLYNVSFDYLIVSIGPNKMRKTETVEWKTLDQKIFRSCHQLISYEDSIFLFFGETQVQHLFSYKVGKYNLLTNELVELSPVFSPASRRNHVCVKKENFVYVFGGEYQRYSDGNELTKYNLDTNEWNLIYFENTDITPSCRIYHCGCSCSKDIYFFGGEYLTEVQFEELWKLDENEKWNHIEPKSYYNPLGRRYASLESNNEYLYLFGGRNEEKRFNDLWQFNTLTCCWKEISTDGNEIPKPRASHTSIIKNNTMWIYGGNNGGITNELFSLDLFSFTWKKYETKNDFPRHWHAATVTNNNELIVHGGRHIQNLDDFILMELPISKNSLCNLLHKKLKKKEFVDILINF